jgi:hypothetical protein
MKRLFLHCIGTRLRTEAQPLSWHVQIFDAGLVYPRPAVAPRARLNCTSLSAWSKSRSRGAPLDADASEITSIIASSAISDARSNEHSRHIGFVPLLSDRPLEIRTTWSDTLAHGVSTFVKKVTIRAPRRVWFKTVFFILYLGAGLYHPQ